MPSRLSIARRPLVGFTLVELVVVVTVVAIMAAIAVPSFTQMVANARVRSAAGTLQAALLKTRSEALKRNCTVTLQRRGASWSEGWDVLARTDDCSRAADDEYADADLLLHSDEPANVNVATVPANVAEVRYLQSGRAQGAGPAFLIRDIKAVAKRRCTIVEIDGAPKVVEAGKHTRCPEPA